MAAEVSKPRKIRSGLVWVGILSVIVAATVVGSFIQLTTTSHDTPASGVPPGISVTGFALETPSRLGPNPDPKETGLVSIVDTQDVTLRARAEGVKDVYVIILRPSGTVATASGKPDANGDVIVKLHLPERGQFYALQAYGLVQNELRGGWESGFFNSEPAVPADAVIRIMAQP